MSRSAWHSVQRWACCLTALGLVSIPSVNPVPAVVTISHEPLTPDDSQSVNFTSQVAPLPTSLKALRIVVDGDIVKSCRVDTCEVTLPAFVYRTVHEASAVAEFENGKLVWSEMTNFTVGTFFRSPYGLHPNHKFDAGEIVRLMNDLNITGMRNDMILEPEDLAGHPDNGGPNGLYDYYDRTNQILDNIQVPDFKMLVTIWGPYHNVNDSRCDSEDQGFAYPRPSSHNEQETMDWFLDRITDIVNTYGNGPNCTALPPPDEKNRCGTVQAWQIGNEVYGAPRVYFWGTSSQYVETLNRAYMAIKGADPNAVVLAGGIPGLRQGDGSFEAPPSDLDDVPDHPNQAPNPLSDKDLCDLNQQFAQNTTYAADYLGYVWKNGLFDHYVDIHVYDTPETIMNKTNWILDIFEPYQAVRPRKVTGLVLSETANQKHTSLTHPTQAIEVPKRYAFSATAGRTNDKYGGIVSAMWMGGLSHNYGTCAIQPNDSKALRCLTENPLYDEFDRPSFDTYRRMVDELAPYDNVEDMITNWIGGCPSPGSCDLRGEFRYTAAVTNGGVTQKCLVWYDVGHIELNSPCGLTGTLHRLNLTLSDDVTIVPDSGAVYVDKFPALLW